MENGNNQPQDRSDLPNNLDNTSEQLREGGSENEGEQEPPKLAPPPGNGHDLPEPPHLIANSEFHHIKKTDGDPPPPL